MTQQASKFGIYVNHKENTAVRITSPYWIPEPPDWTYLTDEVNATLLKIRELAKEKSIGANPEAIQWTQIPLRE